MVSCKSKEQSPIDSGNTNTSRPGSDAEEALAGGWNPREGPILPTEHPQRQHCDSNMQLHASTVEMLRQHLPLLRAFHAIL